MVKGVRGAGLNAGAFSCLAGGYEFFHNPCFCGPPTLSGVINLSYPLKPKSSHSFEGYEPFLTPRARILPLFQGL